MTVRARLVLMGAVAPAVALILVAVIAGAVLERRLRRELDDHLLAQAAIESVGLFDGPDEAAHLHAHQSPLAADLDEIIPDGAVYDSSGRRVVVTREGALVPERLLWAGAVGAVTIRDGRYLGRSMRELVATVDAPSEKRYTLYLAVPTHRVASTMRSYWLGAGAALIGVGLGLVALQLVAAGRLAGRIGALRAYLPRLREGRAEPAPPLDRTRDELAALRDGLYQAARELENQRASEQRWLAAAAHDLRTPLGVIRTTVDLALRRPRSEDELRAALEQVGTEIERLRGLAQALLAARRGEVRRTPVDLVTLVREAVETMAAEAEAVDVALRLTAPTSAVITGDAVGLRRVVDNLLHNAIGHAPSGTAVDVTVERQGPQLRIRVRDQGVGIAAVDREQVFHPFWRGPTSTGAGLGLAIVRQVAAEHGGDARIAASAGPGAEVVVELPTD